MDPMEKKGREISTTPILSVLGYMQLAGCQEISRQLPSAPDAIVTCVGQSDRWYRHRAGLVPQKMMIVNGICYVYI